MSYKDSGVDIDEGDRFVADLKKINPSIGGFGGYLSLPAGVKRPKLVLSTDGVGSKILVAQELKILDTIGIDLVAMVVNDIITSGARPMAFLDYYATNKLTRQESSEIIRGIVAGCKQANCQLVGGETAEMPGVYPRGGFDLAGFGVGIVEGSQVIDGRRIKPGDAIIGIASSGVHSNGFSLARKALLEGKKGAKGAKRKAVLEQLLKPTAIYVAPILKLIAKIRVKGIAHITGGGLGGNLVRVLPKSAQAILYPTRWEQQEIFQLIARNGPVSEKEMYNVFNMGIGMCVIVDRKDAKETIKFLRRSMTHAEEIGMIRKGKTGVTIDGVMHVSA
ncbi:phosphoribosylformylglycinamidine cyclo-ligase [Candidatus Sumerlaeota bacterium]|nr:phosphoribosylformylglycinamidine cyclo-ligase [Candidatus Sumerlaeota bacterium]